LDAGKTKKKQPTALDRLPVPYLSNDRSLKQVGKSDVFMPKIIFLVVQAVPLHRINKEDLNKGVTES
jgi:hypothetical protein